jgi:AcrR family transcriptional regulator
MVVVTLGRMTHPSDSGGHEATADADVVRGASRREAIVEAALEMFGKRGYHGTSVRAVAERCGVSHQSLMYYFPTKHALLEAALRRRDEFLSSHFGAEEGLDPRTLIELALANRSQPGHVEIFTSAAADATAPDHPAHIYYQEFYGSLVAALARHLEREFASGLRRPVAGLDALSVGRAVLGLQDGLQLQWLYDRDQDVAGTMMTVLDALAPPTQALPPTGEVGSRA